MLYYNSSNILALIYLLLISNCIASQNREAQLQQQRGVGNVDNLSVQNEIQNIHFKNGGKNSESAGELAQNEIGTYYDNFDDPFQNYGEPSAFSSYYETINEYGTPNIQENQYDFMANSHAWVPLTTPSMYGAPLEPEYSGASSLYNTIDSYDATINNIEATGVPDKDTQSNIALDNSGVKRNINNAQDSTATTASPSLSYSTPDNEIYEFQGNTENTNVPHKVDDLLSQDYISVLPSITYNHIQNKPHTNFVYPQRSAVSTTLHEEHSAPIQSIPQCPFNNPNMRSPAIVNSIASQYKVRIPFRMRPVHSASRNLRSQYHLQFHQPNQDCLTNRSGRNYLNFSGKMPSYNSVNFGVPSHPWLSYGTQSFQGNNKNFGVPLRRPVRLSENLVPPIPGTHHHLERYNMPINVCKFKNKDVAWNTPANGRYGS